MEARPTPAIRKPRGRVEIDIQKCKGCELCTDACKKETLVLSDAINIKGYHYVIVNNDACNACLDCALVCPDAVITVYKLQKSKKVNITPPDIKEQLRAAATPKTVPV
ncbi:MAG: ferredoxin family protein [Cyclobacteriaceae bacterium]|nr:ferredoxin family protein [Cyclobacteriaceae bacterium]